MKDGCGMGIGMLIVKDNTYEPEVVNPCLNWEITR